MTRHLMSRLGLLGLAVLLMSSQGCMTFFHKHHKKAPEGAASAAVRAIYNVRDYGATGDGKTTDTAAVNKAIDAAAEAGGGMVFLPAGTYLCGSIHMKSNINLHIEQGATIKAARWQNTTNYDPSEPFEAPAWQDGGHTYFHNSLIWGENLTNVSITGTGLIDGSNLSAGDGPQDKISGFANFGKPQSQWVDPKTQPEISSVRVGNKAIALKLCRSVLIRDVTIFKGGHFAILTTGCQNMTIDNVTIDTNRDGMDIDCCRNVMVSNCRVNSPGDDGICPKATFALGKNVPCEDMVITNCTVSGFVCGTLLDGTMVPRPNGNGRIKFGTEANGGFRNVTISNCTFRACRGLALEEVDGGIMDNISISNLTMLDVPTYAIYITTGKRNRGPAVKAPSLMRNISISHVVAYQTGPQIGIQITGLAEQPIENLRLEDIRMVTKGGGTAAQAAAGFAELGTGYPEPRGTAPSYGVYARHVKGLELANINLSTAKEDLRPAAQFEDVKGLEIDNFKAQLAPEVPFARFKDVEGVVVRNSPGINPKVGVPTPTAPVSSGSGSTRTRRPRAAAPAPAAQ